MASFHLVFSHTWTRKLSVVLKVSYGESSSSSCTWEKPQLNSFRRNVLSSSWERFSAKSWSSNPAFLCLATLSPIVHSKLTGIKLFQQVYKHKKFCSYGAAWCCQKLFQLLTWYRVTLRSQTGKFCQENCTSRRAQTCSITLQHWKWFRSGLLCFTLRDFQAQKFCLELSFDLFFLQWPTFEKMWLGDRLQGGTAAEWGPSLAHRRAIPEHFPVAMIHLLEYSVPKMRVRHS